MRIFLRTLLPFLLIQGLILAAVFGFSSPDRQGMMSASLDKRHRLLTAAPPRLVLVGGSSVGYGFDSPTLEKQLKLNVVNMGLHAGLGLSYILAESQSVQKGDTVILAIEYNHFFKDQTQWSLVEQSLTLEPAVIKDFNGRQILGLLDHGLSLISLQMKGVFGWKHEGGMVLRSQFNEQGDIVFRPADRPRWVPSKLKTEEEAAFLNHSFPQTFYRAVDELNAFDRACAERGAHVFFFYAPRPRPVWDAEIYEWIDKELRHRLIFPILNHPEDEVYPVADIYDTSSHLTASGASERTAHLVKCLESMDKTLGTDANRGTP
jgi:hypothetical protein